MPRHTSITTSLLRSHFPIAQTLSEYLTDILAIGNSTDADEQGYCILTKVDSPAYQDLVTTTMVAVSEKPSKQFRPSAVRVDMREVRFQ